MEDALAKQNSPYHFADTLLMGSVCSQWLSFKDSNATVLAGCNTSIDLSFMDRNCYALNISNAVINYTLWSKGQQQDSLKKAVTLSQKCKAASPNQLTFADTQNFTVDIWTYPADADSAVNMNLCVGFFFFLSFIFQLSAMVCGGEGGCCCNNLLGLGYWYLFPDDHSGDDSHVDFLRRPNAVAKIQTGSGSSAQFVHQAQAVARHMDYEMRINWLRFVEYSASGSLVLFTIAILAGVIDINLLVCMFFLSATCMLLGIVAEMCLRIKNALKMFRAVALDRWNVLSDTDSRRMVASLEAAAGLDAVSKERLIRALGVCQDTGQFFAAQLDTIANMLYYGFYLSHILGWVCIAVPWVIVWNQLEHWYAPCEAESLLPPSALLKLLGVNQGETASSQVQAQDTGRKPPGFLKVSHSYDFGNATQSLFCTHMFQCNTI
jgi:hypothetical protein